MRRVHWSQYWVSLFLLLYGSSAAVGCSDFLIERGRTFKQIFKKNTQGSEEEETMSLPYLTAERMYEFFINMINKKDFQSLKGFVFEYELTIEEIIYLINNALERRENSHNNITKTKNFRTPTYEDYTKYAKKWLHTLDERLEFKGSEEQQAIRDKLYKKL